MKHNDNGEFGISLRSDEISENYKSPLYLAALLCFTIVRLLLAFDNGEYQFSVNGILEHFDMARAFFSVGNGDYLLSIGSMLVSVKTSDDLR